MDIAERAKQITPSLTLEITAKAKQMKADGIDVVSFGAGEPDFNTPDYIIEAACQALHNGVTKYTPASGTDKLKAAVCQKFKADNGLEYEPKNIVISNGAKHTLYNALACTVNEGDEVIIPAPYWLTYPELVKLCGGVPKYVHTKHSNSFKLTAAELEKAITDKTKAIIINDPCNPTGAVYSRAELESLAAVIEKHPMYVISDEIYEKLIYDGEEHYSIASYSPKLKDLTIVVNGMSKTYSMTGWRIGYCAANKALASAMSSMQSHCTSNPNSAAQYASVVALTSSQGGDFLKAMLSTFDARRQLISEKLDALDVDYIKPKGAFYVMASVKSWFGKSYHGSVINSAHDVASLLLEFANTAVIPCEGFGAGDYIRLSYAVGEADIVRGLNNITEFAKKLD